jgi:UDP-N-acetylglucosamine-lysosomal-enzyme
VYFNFSTVVNNDTITSAVRSPSHIVRTSILSKPYKILSLTFARNISKSSTHFTIKTQSTTISFTVIADTFKTNHTSSAADSNNKWSFVEYNDTTEQKFIDSLAIKVRDVDNSINAWVTERPTDRMALSPESSHHYYPNYTVANMSALPSNIAKELVRLQQELKDGDLTMKGFIKKQAVLLQPYSFLSEIQIIPTDVPNSNHRDSVAPSVNTNGHPSRARSELWHQEQKGTRHLMGVADFPSSWLPWERYNVFPSEVEEQEGNYRVPHYNSRKLLDTFADSLRYVNVLYTKEYGHRSRKVPAHMPHMINKYIMEELQRKYATQYDLTSSHKLRNVKDMQFAFSYFYYIMSEEVKVPINEVFDKLDTDRSGILSVRELRTLLVKVMEIPLTSKKIHEFESMLRFCAHNFNGTSPSVDPMDFESHYDPDLPLITLDFLTNCSALMSKIIKIYSSKPKYSCIQTDEEQVQFKMLTHNSTKVLAKLDEVRNDQRKFICLNDNLDHSTEDSKIARLLLQDFYESLFPLQSQFELPQNYRNRFLFMEELQKWLYMRWKVKITLQILCVILVGFCITSLFYGKIVQWKRKLFRICSNIFRSKRTTGKASTV